jgi:uncharacterized protein
MNRITDILTSFAASRLQDAEPGHDLLHSQRVLENARQIMQHQECDKEVVMAACLLHDLADHKFANEQESVKDIKDLLDRCRFTTAQIQHTIDIITRMSFSKEIAGTGQLQTAEFEIVQDADRLDALGAIGIARAFSYGGYRKRPFYADDDNSTIAHFHQKLLKLSSMMKTAKGRQMAEERHEFMVLFLNQLNKDCHL